LNSEVVRKPDFPESKSRICNDTIVHWRVLRLCDVPLCGRPKTARDSVVCSLTMHIVASPCDDVQTQRVYVRLYPMFAASSRSELN
jgi:hypothetical protein